MMRVAVFGSTGSIGLSTLDVLERHPDRYTVTVLAAGTNGQRLLEQCRRHSPRIAVLQEPAAAAQLTQQLQAEGLPTRVLCGAEALVDAAGASDVDAVMAAIVGAAGLPSTLAAARAGKRVLLANKESLVVAGPLLLEAARSGGASLIPIDSEHNAVFQCLPERGRRGERDRGVRRLLLTASGGPFLRRSLAEMRTVSADEACAHPRWRMGRKISVDSATLMNKGLELIEACLLFGMEPRDVQVVVHPQSIVHSLVEFVDGSILAQLGNPDMRTPIAHALGWPERIESGVESLDLVAAARLDFEAPDDARFPGLGLARSAAEAGGTAPAALNSANEVAVARFLAGQIGFLDIARTIEAVLAEHEVRAAADLESVMAADAWARQRASDWLAEQERTGALRQ